MVKYVRVLVAMVVAVLFVVFFLTPLGTAESLSILPRIQLIPSLIRFFISGMGMASIAWLFVFLLSAVFGRWYCSSLCPLGTLQDVISRVGSAIFRRNRRSPSHAYRRSNSFLRYGWMLAVIISASAGTMVLLNLTEPYRLFGMIVRDFATPLAAIISYGLFFLLKPLGVFLSPIVVPVDGVLFAVSVLVASSFAFAVVLRGRIFCNTLCPAGAMLSILARRSLFRIRLDSSVCTQCRECETHCKAECIESSTFHVDHARCVLCFNCTSACKFDAIRYGSGGINTFEKGPALADEPPQTSLNDDQIKNVTRRAFVSKLALSTPAIFPLSFLIRRRARTPDNTEQTPCTPPGSHSIRRFSRRCISCHLCVSRCPTGVLQPSLFEYGISGLMQPTMDYKLGFCEYECNECSRVCPTGAIMPVLLAEKKSIQIGRMKFVRDRCIVETNGTACGACAEVCPTHSVYMVPYNDTLDIPETDDASCIGCGNCEFSCPARPDRAIYVIGESLHRVAQDPRPETAVRKDRDSERRNNSDDDFPF